MSTGTDVIRKAAHRVSKMDQERKAAKKRKAAHDNEWWRKKLAEDVAAWEAKGNKPKQLPTYEPAAPKAYIHDNDTWHNGRIG